MSALDPPCSSKSSYGGGPGRAPQRTLPGAVASLQKQLSRPNPHTHTAPGTPTCARTHTYGPPTCAHTAHPPPHHARAPILGTTDTAKGRPTPILEARLGRRTSPGGMAADPGRPGHMITWKNRDGGGAGEADIKLAGRGARPPRSVWWGVVVLWCVGLRRRGNWPRALRCAWDLFGSRSGSAVCGGVALLRDLLSWWAALDHITPT